MEEKAKLPKATEENLRVYNEMQKLASEVSDKKRQIELGFYDKYIVMRSYPDCNTDNHGFTELLLR